MNAMSNKEFHNFRCKTWEMIFNLTNNPLSRYSMSTKMPIGNNGYGVFIFENSKIPEFRVNSSNQLFKIFH